QSATHVRSQLPGNSLASSFESNKERGASNRNIPCCLTPRKKETAGSFLLVYSLVTSRSGTPSLSQSVTRGNADATPAGKNMLRYWQMTRESPLVSRSHSRLSNTGIVLVPIFLLTRRPPPPVIRSSRPSPSTSAKSAEE